MSPSPARAASHPRVAIVHDWLTGRRGGEKVLEEICALYPDATIFTLVRVPGSVSPRIERQPIRTSLAAWLPRAGRWYRHYLPLYPTLVELFDLDGFDLVISSSHCAVKSAIPGGALHVCYCHSPMRYAWDQFGAYFGPGVAGAVPHRLLRPVMAGLARWDVATAGRVHAFVANSAYVAGRIRRYYNREATVVYPPVDTEFYAPATERRASDSGFLVVSALVPYKRLDLAVDACRQARAPLTVVGQGPELARLQRRAGTDVRFVGWRSDEEVRELYRSATAVLLPGLEDFGIVPVEAQACGTPVIALRAGGALETVVDGETGVLVAEPTSGAFAEAVERVQRQPFDRAVIRRHAERFSKARFRREFGAAVAAARSARQRESIPLPEETPDADVMMASRQAQP